MINFDDYTNENEMQHNSKWLYIPDHPYRVIRIIILLSGSGSGKINKLLNLTNKQPDIDKINLYAKDQHENKYQILTKKSESIGLKRFNDLKAFIEYSNDMQDVKYIDKYNLSKKHKILIVFADMIADMINNKNVNSIVTELFIRGRKISISLVFITQ